MKMGWRLRCSSVTYPFRYAPSSRLAGGPFLIATPLNQSRTWCTSASSHNFEICESQFGWTGSGAFRGDRFYIKVVSSGRLMLKVRSEIGPAAGQASLLLHRHVSLPALQTLNN